MSAKENKSSEDQWFLRTGPDAVFGPVEKKGLQLWAQQARILPGHEVSTDRKNWKSVLAVDFLDMCWFIDDGEGDFKGPLNRKAAETLVENGKFSAEARILSASEASENSEKPDTVSVETEEAIEKADDSAADDAGEEMLQMEEDSVKNALNAADKAAVPDDRPADSAETEQNTTSQAGIRTDKSDESDMLKALREQSRTTITELNKKVRQLEENLHSSEFERRRMDAATVSSEVYHKLRNESDALRCDLAAAQKKTESLQCDIQDRDNRIEKLENQLNRKNALLAENERKLRAAVQTRERALQQCRESERSFARLLNDSNKRDVEYKARIDALKQNISLSPDQTDRFYSDQNAVYQILKRELDTLTKTMDSERAYLDSLKQLEAERLKELEKRRQSLQNHLGNSPAEMTGRVLREQTSDPNAVRMRSELDNLKIAHERAVHRYEERERELTHKLKIVQTDYANLMSRMLEKERETEALQQLKEKFVSTEKELTELRRSYEAERRQFVAGNNALAARVSELEGGSVGSSPGEIQALDAKGVKL
ncbi:MAG: hypothetical protein R6V06_00175 [Kiritimatiellia bacterium]